jgi:hypothetical protein
MHSQWTIHDLILLKDAGVLIDAADFVSVLRYENLHRNFSACSHCCAVTWTQHQPSCPWASVLHDKNWFEILQGREQM